MGVLGKGWITEDGFYICTSGGVAHLHGKAFTSSGPMEGGGGVRPSPDGSAEHFSFSLRLPEKPNRLLFERNPS